MIASIVRRVALFVVVASGMGCAAPAAAPPAAPPSFRPAPGGTQLWLATPIAVEITCETDARTLEALDATYVGELGVSGGRVRPAELALLAAEKGATHFRVISAGDELRVDVLLFRVEAERWSSLPETLRPARPAPQRHSSL